MLQHVGFNIEIKLATSAALAQTPQQELERINNAIVTTIASCGSSRTLAISSFDPDVMAHFMQHCGPLRKHFERVSMWFLTSGHRELVHVDARRRSVAEAAAIAHKLELDGIVVETTLLQTEHADVVAAMHDGLNVRPLFPFRFIQSDAALRSEISRSTNAQCHAAAYNSNMMRNRHASSPLITRVLASGLDALAACCRS